MRILAAYMLLISTMTLTLSMPPAAAETDNNNAAIVCPQPSAGLEAYAARELRRYVYLRTQALLPITADMPTSGSALVLLNIQETAAAPLLPAEIAASAHALEPEAYLMQSVDAEAGTRCVYLVGGSPVAVLYAAYRFAETMGVRFYLHGDVLPDAPIPFALPEVKEERQPLFQLRGIQPFHDFPEGPDWWNREQYRAIVTQLPKLGMNFIGLHTYPLSEPTVWVGRKEDVDEHGQVNRSYPAQYYNTAQKTGFGYIPKKTSAYAFGAGDLFARDDYGVDFLSDFTPTPNGDEAANAVFNRTGDLFKDAFTLARELQVRTCIGTETPLRIPDYIVKDAPAPESAVQPLGGAAAVYGAPIRDTEDDPLYQSVRYNLAGYRIQAPNGKYRVTLKFCEVAYDTVGARVFDVALQGTPVATALDVFARVGKNHALDLTFEDIEVTDGTLNIAFTPVVEFPAIAAIEAAGPETAIRVNCGGDAYQDWAADAGIAYDPALIQSVYEGVFSRIMRAHPLDYYWFWTPENWTWSGASEAEAQRTVTDILAAQRAKDAVNAPFELATCGWVLGPPFNRAWLDAQLPKDIQVSCINRHLGYEPLDAAFSAIAGRGKWAIPWVEDDPAMSIPQFWARRMRRDAQAALHAGCTGLMGIFWRTRVIAPTLAALARAGWNQQWPDLAEPAGHYRMRDVEAGFPVYTSFTTADIDDTDLDPVYASARLDANLYALALPNGRYQVTLHFCEPTQLPGARVFDVRIQNAVVRENFDIAKEVGVRRALACAFSDIVVDDGRLRIAFHRKKDWPIISAIEAVGDNAFLKINCGAGASGDFQADVPHWSADPDAHDFYLDWAKHEFGPEIAEAAARIFAEADGTHPRTSSWIDGPGLFFPDERPWELAAYAFAFVDEFETLENQVQGNAARDRYAYWRHTLAFLRATGKMNCQWARFNRAFEQAKQATDPERAVLLREQALPERIALAAAAAEVYQHLLATVNTPGELGTLCNFESRTLIRMLEEPGKELSTLLGAPLPPEAELPRAYDGPPRLFTLAARTSRRAGESLDIKAAALSAAPIRDVVLKWRPLGEGDFSEASLPHVARNVYRLNADLFPPAADIEYYLEMHTETGDAVLWPASAPALNQTVVIL